MLRASVPESALEEHRGASVDLILSDVVTPGMSGPDFVNAWETRHGPTRVLYMSGYADETVLTEDVSLDDLLTKPFTAAGLLKRVGEALKDGE